MTAPDPVTAPAEIRAGVVTVTPQRALEWLKLNTHNRDLRRDRIEAYARDMRNGHWEVNGEAVKFSAGKILLDGQHRLEAVFEAQVDVDMLVVTGLPESAQETMDQGAALGSRSSVPRNRRAQRRPGRTRGMNAPKTVRDLLMWTSEPHPEWHDPDHPINRYFRRDRDEDAVEPSGRRAEPRSASRSRKAAEL